MNEPLWALASGCVPDAPPWEIPRIAHAAGFSASGMWVDPKTTWQGDALAKTVDALEDTGIDLVDVEVVWLDEASGKSGIQGLIVETGLLLGARNVLVVSRHDDVEAAKRQFEDLCVLAGGGIRIVLEFAEFSAVKSLSSAIDFVTSVGHPAGGVLIDLMHLNRSGEAMPNLELESNRHLFPYIQGCDFWQDSAALSGAQYIEAAIDARCPLGEGEAPASNILAMGQSTLDVSLEIRSKRLRDEFPDPVERARQIHKRCIRG